MFIPLFIALLLGLVNPAQVNQTNNCNSGGTVVLNSDGEPGTPGEPGDPGDPDDPGTDGPGSGGPSGNTGQNPPKP